MHDRLSGRYVPDDVTSELAAEIDERLDRWQSALGGGSPGVLDRRLAWDGHDRRSIRPLLGRVKLARGEPAPAWAEILRRCMNRAASFAESSREEFSFVDGNAPMPFEEVYLPFVAASQELLETRAGASLAHFSAGARRNMQLGLLARLTSISSAALDLEYAIFREERASLWRLEAAVLGRSPSRQIYEKFVQALLRDGLLDFYQKYPVLGRLAGTAIQLWLDALVEMIARFNKDLPQIEGVFHGGAPAGAIEHLQLWLSDRHHGGRTVMRATFTSGLQIIYKPKCIRLEREFSNLLGWLSKEDLDLPFAPLKVLSMEGYGWVECARHRPCQNEAEARRYYLRAGMLLCLAHAMEATDCHHENLLADGEFPQWVDLETLMQCPTRPQDGSEKPSAPTLANALLAKSVLK
ncbi:MAG TPA: DUF4135 domain-containing protein, partial [Verrucomicrobiae bacterium]|nr:DUF4135 domain-containing protein [Verrucomicrobiae bacterium]